ncbi:MAG: hypothetical protein AAGK09_07375 [Planctomycetota bacterium]
MTLIDWLLQPTTLIAAIPIVLVMAVITFEVGMALTIWSLPRKRGAPLTPEHWRRLRRTWLMLLLAWPVLIGGGLVVIVAPPAARYATLALAGMAIVWGLVAMYRRGRWRRHLAEGKCVGCGYDLRGTAEHRDECPECGCSITGQRASRAAAHKRRADPADVASPHRDQQVPGLSHALEGGE